MLLFLLSKLIIIKGSEDQILELVVYNCRDKIERNTTIIPSRNWPGQGLLGARIRFEGYNKISEN
jgi:hypothetical protein